MRVVLEQVLDLIQREAKTLQVADGLQLLHLVDAVVAVACPVVHLVRQQQTLLLIMTQSFYCDLHQLGELSDF